MFINFMKYDFKECIRRLKNEIDNINNKKIDSKIETSNRMNEDENQKNTSVSNNQIVINEKLLSMTESDVDEWLISKQFRTSIVNCISPCN